MEATTGINNFEAWNYLILAVIAFVFLVGSDEVKEFVIKILFPAYLFILIVLYALFLVAGCWEEKPKPSVSPVPESEQQSSPISVPYQDLGKSQIQKL